MEKLVDQRPGTCVIVQEVNCPGKITKRLYEMGLHTGAQLEVKKNDRGPLVMGVHGANIAIGRKSCASILVLPKEVC